MLIVETTVFWKSLRHFCQCGLQHFNVSCPLHFFPIAAPKQLKHSFLNFYYAQQFSSVYPYLHTQLRAFFCLSTDVPPHMMGHLMGSGSSPSTREKGQKRDSFPCSCEGRSRWCQFLSNFFVYLISLKFRWDGCHQSCRVVVRIK